jgi:phosphoribosylanthranilate isomerase
MIDGIRIKICGLTSLVDADFADRCGVDYLGFNLYPKSPRYVSLEQFNAMSSRLPDRRKVAVLVEPSRAQLEQAKRAGFDFFQVHFRLEHSTFVKEQYPPIVGADRLWLAPKLPPDRDVPADLMGFASTFLLDTFHAEKFGGSGKTGDWPKFARHRATHGGKTWILSGGLNPDNIGAALRASGARFVDINSGVESAPGIKDEALLKRFVVRLHESQEQAGR